MDADNRSCVFRIALIGSRVFGRGFGTEAIRLILAHAFDTVGVHRVELEVYSFNPRARHVYEQVGAVTTMAAETGGQDGEAGAQLTPMTRAWTGGKLTGTSWPAARADHPVLCRRDHIVGRAGSTPDRRLHVQG